MKILCKFALSVAFVLLFANFASAQTDREKGIEYYLTGDYPKAVESLQKAVKADEKNQESWLFLGISFAKLKLDKKSLDAFKKADKLSLKTFAENEKDAVITSKPRPSYTDEGRMNQVQGEVAIAIEFSADGTLKCGFLVKSLPSGLTQNALKAAAKIKFQPATKDGKPVTTIKIIKYSFAVY